MSRPSYYERNRERLKAAARARYQAQKDDPEFRAKINARNRARDAENPERKAEYGRRYRAKVKTDPLRLERDRLKSRLYTRKKTRRLSGVKNPTAELKVGMCSVRDCPYVGPLVFDHWHAGPKDGEFRGWLCSNCNSGLGFFADNPDRLRAAAEYLELAAGVGWPKEES